MEFSIQLLKNQPQNGKFIIIIILLFIGKFILLLFFLIIPIIDSTVSTVYSPLPLFTIELLNCNNYLVSYHYHYRYQTLQSQEATDKYHGGFTQSHFHQELVVIT